MDEATLAIFVAVIAAGWAYYIADKKDRCAVCWAFICFILPLAIIILFFLKNVKDKNNDKSIIIHNIVGDNNTSSDTSSKSINTQIEELYELNKKSIITNEEFRLKKQKLLGL